MKITNQLAMLEISANVLGNPSVIYPTLLWDDQTMLLVDTGFPGQLPLFQATITGLGLEFARLNQVLITHQDIDHIGSLPALVEALPEPPEVLAHENEKPYIQGDQRLIKFSAERLATLPEEQRQRMQHVAANLPKAKVTRTVSDGEFLHWGGGITVIHTPGHTPGHICLYLHDSKTLVTGDALNVIDQQLIGAIPNYTQDIEQAAASLRKLAQYDIENVISYHGGLYRGNVNARIAELAEGTV